MRFALVAIIFQAIFVHTRPNRDGDTVLVKVAIWFAILFLALMIAVNTNNALDRFRRYLLTKQDAALLK